MTGLKQALTVGILVFGLGTAVGCGAKQPAPDYDGDPDTDAIMLSDNSIVVRDGDGWNASPPGVAANVIHAPDARHNSLEEVSPNCKLFRNVTLWDSNEGVSPIVLSSSLQSGRAEYNGTNYMIGGLAGAAAYSSTEQDHLTVSHTPGTGDELSITIDAPPAPADIADVLGAPAGAATTFSMPDAADGMFLYVVASATGENGLMCHRYAAEMTADGDRFTAPLLDSDAAAALAAEGWDVASVSVAYYTEEMTDLFFPGLRPAPVQAGRMFTISGTDLGF